MLVDLDEHTQTHACTEKLAKRMSNSILLGALHKHYLNRCNNIHAFMSFNIKLWFVKIHLCPEIS